MGQPQGIFFPSILLTFPGILNNCSLPGRGGWEHWVKVDCTQEGCDEQTAVPLQYQYMPLEEKSIVAKSALANFLQQKKNGNMLQPLSPNALVSQNMLIFIGTY